MLLLLLLLLLLILPGAGLRRTLRRGAGLRRLSNADSDVNQLIIHSVHTFMLIHLSLHRRVLRRRAGLRRGAGAAALFFAHTHFNNFGNNT